MRRKRFLKGQNTEKELKTFQKESVERKITIREMSLPPVRNKIKMY